MLEVLRYPDPMLKRICDPVAAVNDDIRTLVADMLETMVARHGVGLAAPQVGRPLRLFVVGNYGDRLDPPLVFINPRIYESRGTQRAREGCLSLPGVFEHVTRARKIRVAAQDVNGARFEMTAEDFLAVIIQHENDHLRGALMLDHLSPLVKKMAVKSLT